MRISTFIKTGNNFSSPVVAKKTPNLEVLADCNPMIEKANKNKSRPIIFLNMTSKMAL